MNTGELSSITYREPGDLGASGSTAHKMTRTDMSKQPVKPHNLIQCRQICPGIQEIIMCSRKRNLVTTLLVLFTCTTAVADQSVNEAPWNGKQAAVSLTYDDTLNVHLDNVIPVLNELHLRGTFYITGSFKPLEARLQEWRSISQQGHELGNHTLFHPCIAQGKGREWVAPEQDLSQWSFQRYTGNLTVNSLLLSAIDEKSNRSFAYPCGDTTVEGKTYIPFIQQNFSGARAVGGEPVAFSDVDLMNIPSYMVSGDTAEAMINKAKQALKNKGWLVFLFHGVGGEHALDVDLKQHQKLVQYLAKNQQDFWVAPVVDISEFVKSKSLSPKTVQ